MLLGEFIALLGIVVIPRIKNLFNGKIKYENWEELKQKWAQNELIVNTLYPNKPQHEYTF